MIKKKYNCLSIFIGTLLFNAQENELKTSVNGFLDTYSSYDFNNPVDGNKPAFIYNHHRNNELNVNIAFLRTKLEYQNFYASIGLQAGTYIEKNYANENLKLLNEAYVGIYLDKDKKHNLEVGILPSYIGFETATSSSNFTFTRSLIAENSPYYFTGIKYLYLPTNHLTMGLIVSNGWQNIKKVNSKAAPSFGTKIEYKPNDKVFISWNTYTGQEPVGAELQRRFFSNIYGNIQWNKSIKSTLGFDFGTQKISENENATWYAPIFVTQFTLSDKWQTTLRIENFKDEKNVLGLSVLPFNVMDYSINIDFLPIKYFKWRTEFKLLSASEKIFIKNDNATQTNIFLTTGLSFEF